MYGAMGSVAAVASLLAGTCLSRCNGCMGCLVGGTGLLGILTGSKMIERFSGARTGKSVPAADLGSEVKKREKGR